MQNYTNASAQLQKLKHSLAELPNNTGCLELAFESAAKHMPIYLKIVKSHIEQLARVLELETHHHRSLENAGLAEPVIQLIHLFRQLKPQDIQLLESLAEEARNWQPLAVNDTISSELTATSDQEA